MNMMTELKTMIVVALVAAAMIGCTDDDTTTAEERFVSQLHGQWTLSGGSVQLGNMDVTGAFAEFELDIHTDKSYSVSAPVDPMWPQQGTFALIKNDAGLFNLLRNDGVLIEVTALTAHELKFNQVYGSASGKTESIDGRYYFSLTK
jgi:hypothetical protein